MNAYKSFCARLSERKKPGRKFLKKTETYILPIHIYHSYSRPDNKTKKRAGIVTLVL